MGAALQAGFTETGIAVPYSERRLGAELAIGLNLPLSADVSLFPQLFAGGGHHSRTYGPELALTMPDTFRGFEVVEVTSRLEIEGPYLSGSLWLPVQLYLAPRVYLAVGPRLRVRGALEDGESTSTLGVMAGAGAAF